MFLKIHKLLEKLSRIWRLVYSAAAIVISISVFLGFLLSHLREAEKGEIQGRIDVGFDVFYMENTLFPPNPIPRDLHFLMSFTDYIEADSSFYAEFNEAVIVEYSYHASQRMVIRHMENQDANLSPIVFEMTLPLSQQQGQLHTDRLQFSPTHDSEAWSGHTVHPKDFIDIYFEFVAAQQRQMEDENVLARSQRGFSAELYIDFTYAVYVPEWGLRETASRGLRIPLTLEVYSIATVGPPAFEGYSVLSEPGRQITLPVIIIIVAVLGLGSYGLFTGIKMLKAHPNKNKQEALTILEKYADEIVISRLPIPLSELSPISVPDFNTLLKLAIGHNKHILCYHDDDHALFVVIVDDHVYRHAVIY